MAIGAGMGNIAVGLAVGISVGTAIGVVLNQKNKVNNSEDN